MAETRECPTALAAAETEASGLVPTGRLAAPQKSRPLWRRWAVERRPYTGLVKREVCQLLGDPTGPHLSWERWGQAARSTVPSGRLCGVGYWTSRCPPKGACSIEGQCGHVEGEQRATP